MNNNKLKTIGVVVLGSGLATVAQAQFFVPTSALAALGVAGSSGRVAERLRQPVERAPQTAEPIASVRQAARSAPGILATGSKEITKAYDLTIDHEDSASPSTTLIRRSKSLLVAYRGQTSQNPVSEVGLQPQIDIAGSAVSTLDIGREHQFGTSGAGSRGQINFSDSALLVGASQRMYRGAIGSFGLGWLTLDDSISGIDNQFFMHQAFLDFQALRSEVYLGRTNTPTSQLVTFPTVREDDMIDFTSVLNPFTNGRNAEEHRYSNVAAVTLNQGLRHFANFHVQHLIDSAGVGGAETGLNSFGVSYQYLGNPALVSIDRFPTYGFGFEHRAVQEAFGGASNVVYFGGVMNLQPSVVNKLDLRLLAQASFGNDTSAFTDINSTCRADQDVIALSIRKLYSPFGRPSSQWVVTAGWKRYPKASGANAFGVDLSYGKSLGAGFDFVAQIAYERRSNTLAPAFGGRTNGTTFQIGFVYNFNSTFNQSVGPRRSITNLMHKYIPN